MKALSSPLLSSLVGGLLYLATTAVLMIRGYVPPPPPAPPALGGDEAHDPSLPPATLDPKNPPPSWSYFNPDVEYLVKELKDQKLGLNSKEKELKELEARILAERLELSAITQQVARLRQEIESSILKMKEDEQLNLKRLAKTYAAMEPAGSDVPGRHPCEADSHDNGDQRLGAPGEMMLDDPFVVEKSLVHELIVPPSPRRCRRGTLPGRRALVPAEIRSAPEVT